MRFRSPRYTQYPLPLRQMAEEYREAINLELERDRRLSERRHTVRARVAPQVLAQHRRHLGSMMLRVRPGMQERHRTIVLGAWESISAFNRRRRALGIGAPLWGFYEIETGPAVGRSLRQIGLSQAAVRACVDTLLDRSPLRSERGPYGFSNWLGHHPPALMGEPVIIAARIREQLADANYRAGSAEWQANRWTHDLLIAASGRTA